MGPSLSLVAVCSVVVKETTSHRWCLVASCSRLLLSAGRPDRAGFTVAIAAAASLRLWRLVKQVTGAPLKCGPSIRLMSWWFNARVHPLSPSGDCRTQAGVSSRRTRLEETQGGGGGTTWLLLLLVLRRPHTHTHTDTLLAIPFFLPSIFYEAVGWWLFRGRGVCRPSAGSALAVSSRWYHWSQAGSTHTHARTHISCRLASGCLSARLHRWLTVALTACVTRLESGVCTRLSARQRVCGVDACVCARSAETRGWFSSECACVMNSSLTQLIAEPAADLAAASSPCDPAAGLWKRDSMWVLSPFPPPPEERGCARAPMNSWRLGFWDTAVLWNCQL